MERQPTNQERQSKDNDTCTDDGRRRTRFRYRGRSGKGAVIDLVVVPRLYPAAVCSYGGAEDEEGSHLRSHLRNCKGQLRTMWSAVGQFLEEEFPFIFTCLDLILRPGYHLLYYACTTNDNMHTISHPCIQSAVGS